MKEVANRQGRNTRLFNYSDGSLALNIPFGRVTTVDASAERTYAKGGVSDADKIGFDDPIKGTFKISTQIIPLEVIALQCNKSGVVTGGEWAVREVLAAETGKITLTETPVAGSIYVYEIANDAVGTPVATSATDKEVTISGAVAGDKYVAYYLKQSSTAKTVTLNNRLAAGTYVIYSDTVFKAEDDTILDEQIKVFKAMPKKAISLTYQGSGDPASMDITFDIMEDDDGNTIKFSREDRA